MWVDSDAVRPGREWRGDLSMMGLIHYWQNFALNASLKLFPSVKMLTFCMLMCMLMSLSVNQIQPLDSVACTAIFVGL